MLQSLMTPLVKPPPHTEIAENIRRRQLAWLKFLVDKTGLTKTEIARQAGVSPSTLSKFENDPDNIAQLEAMTVRKIEASTGYPLASYERAPAAGGLAAPEAEPYAARDGDPVQRALAAYVEGENAIVPWRLNTAALEGAGYLEGDILLVDLNAEPRDGDMVCAQLYDWSGAATTVFRVFQRPFFLTSPGAPGRPVTPILLDGKAAQVRGVVVASLRPRTGPVRRLAS